MKKFYSLFILLFCFVTLAAQTPVANFVASDTATCEGECISFKNLSQNATSYQWFFQGGLPSSSTATDSVMGCYLNAGSYDVTLIAMNGGLSDTLTLRNYITVLPAPPVPIIMQDVCGDSLYCITDTSYVSYQWYERAVLIPGATNPFLDSVDLWQNYNLAVTNKFGCIVSVGVQSLFEPPAFVCDFSSSKNIICKGDCIDFYSTIYFQAAQQWTFAGANQSSIISVSPTSICYDTVGVYDVSLSAWNPVNGGGSLTKPGFITVLPALVKPMITQHYDTLFCSQDSLYSSYQWYLDSAVINGDTNSFITISISGNYSVLVTNLAGCSAFADTTVILGLQDVVNYSLITLSPNPSGSTITIEGRYIFSADPVTIEIMNVVGEVVRSVRMNGSDKITIDIGSLVHGIYFARINNGEKRWTGKFVKG